MNKEYSSQLQRQEANHCVVELSLQTDFKSFEKIKVQFVEDLAMMLKLKPEDIHIIDIHDTQ